MLNFSRTWDIRFLGFVRKDNGEKARARLAGHDKVTFAAIEDATFSWKFWEERKGAFPNSITVMGWAAPRTAIR